ncbi:MAG: ribonuclease PH, partial [Clostridia bacterium]|nr:ribonuclease PH [Clostridia bacterium]
IIDLLAAISVGKVGEEILLDLCYEEDFNAQVDMNVVMTGKGKIVEIQGTAEGYPFTRIELDRMLEYADKGIGELLYLQRELLGKIINL